MVKSSRTSKKGVDVPVIAHNRVGQCIPDFRTNGWEQEGGTCFCGRRNFGPRRSGSTGWLYNYDANDSSYSQIKCSSCGRSYNCKTGELLRDIVEYVGPHHAAPTAPPSDEELAAAKAVVLAAGLSVVTLPAEVPPGEYSAKEAGWRGDTYSRDFHYIIAVHGHLWYGQRCFEKDRPHSHGD